MIWIKENFLTLKQCQEIISSKEDHLKDFVYSEYEVDPKDRKSEAINYRNLNLRYDIIHNLSLKLGLDFHSLDKYHTFELYKYNVGDHFNWHNDITKANEFYTAIIMLNESYEGGSLYLKENLKQTKEIPKETGKLIVFPSKTYHAVTKVTKGARYSLVTWIYSSNKTAI